MKIGQDAPHQIENCYTKSRWLKLETSWQERRRTACTAMTPPELKKAVQDILPQLIAEDPQVRDFVLRTVSNYYASRAETESKFDRVLAELERDRVEQSRKWDEQNQHNRETLANLERDRAEQSRKWDEQSRKWDEQHQQNQNTFATLERDRAEQARKWDEQYQHNRETLAELERDREEQSRQWDEQSRQWNEQNQHNRETLANLERDREEQSRKWDEQSRQWNEQHQQTQTMLAEIQDQKRRYDSSIGAIGSRWGLYSEESFRSGLKGILEQSFGVQVLNINDFDEAGEVFGRPDQVELDIVITNGSVIACEIKSSLSKSDMYSFDRKVAFYQKRHERPVSRKLVISPMVDDRARPVAEALGIEVYSSPQSMPGYRYGANNNVL